MERNLAKPHIPASPLGFALRILAIFLFLLLIWPAAPAQAAEALAKNSDQRHF